MKKLNILFILFTIVSLSAFAQYGSPSAVLEYYDDDLELEITGADGTQLGDIYYGMELQDGDTIRTNRTNAELRLDPNGSIIKLAPFTVFTIESLQRDSEGSNNFNLVSGKIHAIAARAGLNEKYQIRTQSAVCGVRGTDFGVISIPGSEEKAFVLDGLVEYTNNLTDQKIELGAGMMGDVLAEVFQAVQASSEQLNDLVKDVIFEQLNPGEVPGHEPSDQQVDNGEEEQEDNESSEEDVSAETGDENAGSDTEEPKDNSSESKLMAALGEILGLEIGTVTIDGQTFSKAIIKPTFNIGKLKLSLYLPIVYSTDLFDPEDWYHPEGNNEWSFGTDQDGYEDIAYDFINDLFLKIRYVEWGEQRDPFFFKVGNINGVTMGHGILMKNYANDMDFPAIRRVGLNLGIDNGGFGFEGVVDDLADPEIFGSRLYFRPVGKIAFGLSGIVDINPDEYAEDPLDLLYDDTKLITASADIDIPIMENDLFSLILFSDIAGMVPYMDGELKYEMMYDTDASGFSLSNFRNYGWDAGIFGNLTFMKYRLEYRYFDGVFRNSFFSSSYERLRGTYIEDINTYLDDPVSHPDYGSKLMGIYGEGGFTFFDKITATLGYMWPWTEDGASDNDEFLFELGILPGTIPVLDIYGSLSYRRTNFIPTLLNNGSGADLTLFDANTSFQGEIVYPVAPTLDLAAVIGTTMRTDENGVIQYDSNHMPDITMVITIETRLSF